MVEPNVVSKIQINLLKRTSYVDFYLYSTIKNMNTQIPFVWGVSLVTYVAYGFRGLNPQPTWGWF